MGLNMGMPALACGALGRLWNLFGLPVLVDELLAENGEIVFNAGSYTLTVKLRSADFSRLVQPRMASLSVPIG